jgi:hypothetical protein
MEKQSFRDGIHINLYIQCSKTVGFWTTQATERDNMCVNLSVFSTKKFRIQMDLRHKNFYWLLGRPSRLSVDNKLLLYQSFITPIWTHGTELWGCVCKSTIAVIEKCQSKILRVIVDQRYDSQRPRYSRCTRRHAWQKHQAPYKIRILVKPITPTPPTRHRHTKTEKTVASWSVTRRTGSPRQRRPHHVKKSRLPASPLAYRILCTLIADYNK